ncbi:MAG: hypothetical protein ACP5N9_01630 [Candidatus Bilamarchaeum sp.]|jgi:hypothetical protein
MIKNAFLLLIILGLVSAIVVTPDHQGVRNSGDSRLPRLDVDFSVDCPTKTITTTVISEDGAPVQNANMYVFYTNYAYQPIASGRTNQNGMGQLNIVGNPNFLTSLFILHVESSAYQTKEIEFTYEKCFGTVSDEEINNPPPAPTLPAENNTSNNTQPVPTPLTPTNSTPLPQPNNTVNNNSNVTTPSQNNTANQNITPREATSSPGCKMPFAIFGFILVGAILFNRRQ